jgi:hypothetical protein
VAAIHLALDIDSEVYPELHAALTAIGSDASRAERLRQLAATGLVWERIRTGGDGLPGPGLLERPLPEKALPVAHAPTPVAHAPVPVAHAPVAVAVAHAPVRAAAPAPASAGFVDLALDAVQPPPAAAWPPVLVDVVDPEELPAAPHAVPSRRARVPPPAAYAPLQVDEPPEPPPAPPQAPIEHHASTRTRLQRMRDRGLFKNG